MELKIFTFIIYLTQFLRCLLGPLLILISYPFSSKIRRRFDFENKNFDLDLKPKRDKAFMAFEVSSEGEFEQIRPLIDYLLKQDRIVEVIYASESLESKMVSLEKVNKGLRIFRLPVLSFGLVTNTFMLSQNINSFLTAPNLVLCRYDFYPELLLYGLKKSVRFSLASATLKNKENPGLFLRSVFNSFDCILCATSKDEELFKKIINTKASLSTYEFRVIQIMERIKAKDLALEKLGKIIDWITEVESESRIIFGSVWANETKVFLDQEFCKDIKENKLRVVLLPHQFDPSIQSSILGLETYLYRDGVNIEELLENLKNKPGPLLLDIRGILCELVSLFGHSFIGGGHGRSVHSVLEPYLNGCQIYCGPRVHRSTEIDFIRDNEPLALCVIENLEDFYKILKNSNLEDKTEARHKLGETLYSDFENKVNLLLGSSQND